MLYERNVVASFVFNMKKKFKWDGFVLYRQHIHIYIVALKKYM